MRIKVFRISVAYVYSSTSALDLGSMEESRRAGTRLYADRRGHVMRRANRVNAVTTLCRLVGIISGCIALNMGAVVTTRAQTTDLDYQLAYQRGVEAVIWSRRSASASSRRPRSKTMGSHGMTFCCLARAAWRDRGGVVSYSDFRFWHKADIPTRSINVRFRARRQSRSFWFDGDSFCKDC
jgi:hypothetical protein